MFFAPGRTLRQQLSSAPARARAPQNAAQQLRLHYLQQIATWAAVSVPPLGAFLGAHLAATCEILGCPPPPSPHFSCQRCESILQAGVNCSIRIRKRKRKRFRSTGGLAKPVNWVVYTCHHCAFENLKAGTPKDYVKTKLSEAVSLDRPEKLGQGIASGELDLDAIVPVEASLNSTKRNPDENLGSRGSKRKRKGWSSLKDIAASQCDVFSSPGASTGIRAVQSSFLKSSVCSSKLTPASGMSLPTVNSQVGPLFLKGRNMDLKAKQCSVAAYIDLTGEAIDHDAPSLDVKDGLHCRVVGTEDSERRKSLLESSAGNTNLSVAMPKDVKEYDCGAKSENGQQPATETAIDSGIQSSKYAEAGTAIMHGVDYDEIKEKVVRYPDQKLQNVGIGEECNIRVASLEYACSLASEDVGTMVNQVDSELPNMVVGNKLPGDATDQQTDHTSCDTSLANGFNLKSQHHLCVKEAYLHREDTELVCGSIGMKQFSPVAANSDAVHRREEGRMFRIKNVDSSRDSDSQCIPVRVNAACQCSSMTYDKPLDNGLSSETTVFTQNPDCGKLAGLKSVTSEAGVQCSLTDQDVGMEGKDSHNDLLGEKELIHSLLRESKHLIRALNTKRKLKANYSLAHCSSLRHKHHMLLDMEAIIHNLLECVTKLKGVVDLATVMVSDMVFHNNQAK